MSEERKRCEAMVAGGKRSYRCPHLARINGKCSKHARYRKVEK